MKNTKTIQYIYLISGIIFYILTIWFIFNNFSTRFFIPTGIIANLLLFNFKKNKKEDTNTNF